MEEEVEEEKVVAEVGEGKQSAGRVEGGDRMYEALFSSV